MAPLERIVSLDLHGVSLQQALDEIDRQAHLDLTYSTRIVPLAKAVTITTSHVTAGEVLAMILAGTGVRAVATSGGTVVLVSSENAATDTTLEGSVWGRVSDSTSDNPISNAVIGVKGTSLKTESNELGVFRLRQVPSGAQVITVRQVGYVPVERNVPVEAGKDARLYVRLQMRMTRLQEVVTTATGQRRRVEVANDIVVIHVDSVMATAPIATVTDLLETRVPGLTVQHTSGSPGDPSRLRLRGVSSVYANNDPIVIVDGVRVYSAQSDLRSGNLASPGSFQYASPSPLDQIDPQSIETIEVLKGPSAATLYGADAANGVIVVTTKQGRPGPARWRMTASQGMSYMPGQYPNAYFRVGHDYDGSLLFCPLGSYCGAGVDSILRFQALNAPDLTILGHGGNTRVSLGVDGGERNLTYSFTGSVDDETGILNLPSFSVKNFQAVHGTLPLEWMQHPQSLSRWSGTGRITAQIGPTAALSVTSTLTRETQQKSSLEQQLAALMSTYVDRAAGRYYQVQGHNANLLLTPDLVPDFYTRVTDAATNSTTAATLNWQPRTWLTWNADAGLNVINRNDESLLPRGLLDTLGRLGAARGNSVVSTVNLRALATKQLPWGFHLQFATGANYTKTAIADLATSVIGLAEGTTGLQGAGHADAPTATVSDIANFGWYVEPSLAQQRFFISAGLRFDGGSTYGTHVSLPTFPKLGGSWLISDERWFPFKYVFNTLRLRAAYGHAGVQPGISDRLRLYTSSDAYSFVNGGLAQVYSITNLGNTKLRPERSTEIEGGFDADLFSDRLSVSVSAYRKIKKDALLQVPVAPSVYGSNVSIWENIGVVRNTGLEATVTTQLVRTDPVTWSWTLGVSRNKNLLISLAPGMSPFNISSSLSGDASRIAPGYPLFGHWARPILGFADVNGDGIIEAGEVQLGDSLVFLGDAMPKYEASLHTTFSFLRGVLTVDAGLNYQNGLTQANLTAMDNSSLSRAANDPTAPFSQQAAVAVVRQTAYGIIQTVNTLRFNSLSVAFNARPSLARRLGASALSIALQGTNLGLFTNYAGKDPNVNAYATGNSVADTGVLPQSRTWQLTVSARY